MKGFVISAPMTGSGKTTVTLGLLAALVLILRRPDPVPEWSVS